MDRPLRAVIVIVLAAWLMGVDGCNGIGNVGVFSGVLEATSPDARDSTFENPVVVTQDNPDWMGQLILPAGVSSVSQQSYSADGVWTNLSGELSLSEFRRPTHLYQVQSLPVLPRPGSYSGPGITSWGTRGGGLVHRNTYRAELSLEAGAPNSYPFDSGRPLFAKLSDDVALVPIVLISWKLPGNDPTFYDQTLPGNSLFDFIPPVGYPINRPDLYEEPPDELWHECGVQFQVVASFVFELPAGFDPGLHCGVQSATFAGQSQIHTRVRDATAWHPYLGDWIVDELMPIYVAYGELGSCSSGFGGYLGKRIPGTYLIEIDFQRSGVITSHELGHVLLGQNHSPEPANLMTDFPGASDRGLTDAQCEQAHATASYFSERFEDYNYRIGRVDGEITTGFAEAPPGEVPFGPFGVPSPPVPETGPVAASLQCCLNQRSGLTYQDYTCGIGAIPVPDSMCEICCYEEGPHEVAMTLESECPVADIRPDAQCDEICCSTWGDTTPVSRFACDDAAGTEIPCTIGPPN